MNANDQTTDSSHEALLDEAEAMIWALLDDQIEDADVTRLEKLLVENDSVRQRYVECVQLHVDLTDHYGPQSSDAASKSGILSTLIAESLPGANGLPARSD